MKCLPVPYLWIRECQENYLINLRKCQRLIVQMDIRIRVIHFMLYFLGVLLVPCVASGGVLMSTWICCIFWGHLFLGAPLDGCFWSSLGHVSQVWRCVFELARIIKILPFLNCFTIIGKIFGANSSFRVG